MLSQTQKDNTVSFFSNRSTEELVERLEYFENIINSSKKPKAIRPVSKDYQMVDMLYYALTVRGYFE